MLITNLISASKKIFLLTFFSLLGGFSFSQTAVRPTAIKAEEPSNLTKEPQEIDKKALREKEKTVFPVFVKTGNPERDNENYQKAKEAWIQANPLKYENMISANPKTVFSKTEFMTFSEDKRTEILAHPEKFIVE
jgi:hypothetical protein